MQRAFIVTKDSEFAKDYEEYNNQGNQQAEFIKRFFKEHNIESESFVIHGNGSVGKPFPECWKKDIKLDIIPTDKDLDNFEKMLTKPHDGKLRTFKVNSKIGKLFAEECIKEKIVINLYSPKPRDHFNSIGYNAYRYSLFKLDDEYYLEVDSKYLKEDDTPEGFISIKLSEFYIKQEEFESKNKEQSS